MSKNKEEIISNDSEMPIQPNEIAFDQEGIT
jgi:hypothetical protein